MKSVSDRVAGATLLVHMHFNLGVKCWLTEDNVVGNGRFDECVMTNTFSFIITRCLPLPQRHAWGSNLYPSHAATTEPQLFGISILYLWKCSPAE